MSPPRPPPQPLLSAAQGFPRVPAPLVRIPSQLLPGTRSSRWSSCSRLVRLVRHKQGS